MKLTVNKVVAYITTSFFAIASFVTTKSYAALDEMREFRNAFEQALEEQNNSTDYTINIIIGVIILGGLGFLIWYLIKQGNEGREEIRQQEQMSSQAQQQYAYDMAVYEQQKREWDEYQARKRAEEAAAASGQPAPAPPTPAPATPQQPPQATPPASGAAPDLSAQGNPAPNNPAPNPPSNPPADASGDDSQWRPQQ